MNFILNVADTAILVILLLASPPALAIARKVGSWFGHKAKDVVQ